MMEECDELVMGWGREFESCRIDAKEVRGECGVCERRERGNIWKREKGRKIFLRIYFSLLTIILAKGKIIVSPWKRILHEVLCF
jgi:hypothetical protein